MKQVCKVERGRWSHTSHNMHTYQGAAPYPPSLPVRELFHTILQVRGAMTMEQVGECFMGCLELLGFPNLYELGNSEKCMEIETVSYTHLTLPTNREV